MKHFSLDELRKHNGQDEPSVFVAFKGKVYDLSSSRYWNTGLHMRRHRAGTDLTGEIRGAPHGEEVFQRMPQVGMLRTEKDPADAHLPDVLLAVFKKVPMLRRHPHPMTVHFPLAFGMAVPLFVVLYLATGSQCLEITAFSMLVLTLLAAPVAMLTGPYAWWVNYAARWTPYIKMKLSISAIFLVVALTAFLLRMSEPAILTQQGGLRILYVILCCLLPPIVAILGWIGAKMTFPH